MYYLLLPQGMRIIFDHSQLRRETGWLKPRLLRLRLVENEPVRYREVISKAGDDHFERITRDYSPTCRTTARAYLTPDYELARIWTSATNPRQGKISMLSVVAAKDVVAANIQREVSICFANDPLSRRTAFVQRLVHFASRTGRIFENVYEYGPGVWVHETTTIAPGARLVAPVWIGAGIRVPENETLIGPCVRSDTQNATVNTKPIPWADLAEPDWPIILPRIAGRRLRRVTKRAFDIVFGLVAILFTLPLYPLVIAAICIEDGWPPFFSHRRQTAGGKEFPCLKFRTMRKDAEAIKARLTRENQADGPQFYIKHDPRLLQSGAFLRRFQIDELPQFINVVLGHMSIVGPRPSPDSENQYCPAWREARLSVRPGVTGLWQIRRTREPETDFQEWIRFDLEYVQRESWKLDIWIIFKTIQRVLRG